MEDFAAYVASINLSSSETWPYRLKTQPRPTGKSTQAIITTYDLPDGAAPHDTLLDKAGNVWFSDFQHQYISKLDPKTRQGHALSGSHLEARVSDGRPHDHDG